MSLNKNNPFYKGCRTNMGHGMGGCTAGWFCEPCEKGYKLFEKVQNLTDYVQAELNELKDIDKNDKWQVGQKLSLALVRDKIITLKFDKL